MPLLEPSWLGLTITGNARPVPRSSTLSKLRGLTRQARGVSTPARATRSLVIHLSSVSALAYASEPVYGMPSSSNSAG